MIASVNDLLLAPEPTHWLFIGVGILQRSDGKFVVVDAPSRTFESLWKAQEFIFCKMDAAQREAAVQKTRWQSKAEPGLNWIDLGDKLPPLGVQVL